MFEKLFGRKREKIEGKDSDQPSVSGVAHIREFSEEQMEGGDDLVSELEEKMDRQSDLEAKEALKESWEIDATRDENTRAKVKNERVKPKLGERRSDWKDNRPVDESVLDDSDSTEEILDAHADLEDIDRAT